MKFWRVTFDQLDTVEQCVASGTVPVPKQISSEALNDPNEILSNRIRVGDGIVLADFDEDGGRVRAIGLVRSTCTGNVPAQIEWVRVSKTLFPNPRGGVAQWKKEACFKFVENSAEGHKLELLFEQHFPELGDS